MRKSLARRAIATVLLTPVLALGATTMSFAATGSDVASLATANLGKGACSTNTAGGTGYGSSCTGNGGSPEYWCADFARWVWQQEGLDVASLTAAAGSFYTYGQANSTLHTSASYTPQVGDAVVYNYAGGGSADHVALVTKVNSDGSIVTANGDWGGDSGSEATFSSTSSVVSVSIPASQDAVGDTPSAAAMTISAYVTPVGYSASKPKADSIGVYRPGTAMFYEGTQSGGAVGNTEFGSPNWVPLAGDWNGGGTSHVGAYDPNSDTFYLSNNNSTAAVTAKFGNPGWTPIVGDWDGNGTDTIGAYNPATSTFYLSNNNSTAAVTVKFGSPGWVPFIGDWDGSGKDSIGVYQPSTGTFYEGNQSGTPLGHTVFGSPNWIPLAGDWNSDGVTSVGAYNPDSETFYLSNNNSTAAVTVKYGNPGDVPITGAW